ncbi:hypothetical protein NCS52_00577000 [Fusarium sp. LHS14.1]|nr:hypothetical protein NCS52_00577000 [Fusarium sp. LHS14.1]
MCQAVRYVYPGCGHPIRPDSDTWYLERCRIAHDTDSNCWLPQNPPPEFMQERVYPGGDLAEECATCLTLNAWDDDDAVRAWGEENDDENEDEDEDGDSDAGNATQQDTTQTSTDAGPSAEELREAEDLQWAINKMIEIDSDAGGETPPSPENRRLDWASMGLEGSQRSRMKYR